VHSKFGSTSSTPSVMLASQYSNNEKGSKNESSEEKTRSRSVITVLLLICVAVLFYRSSLLKGGS